MGPGAPGQGADRVVQGAAAGLGQVLQLLDAARADSACGEVDDTHEAGVVVGVLQQAQIGQRVFDFGALEEAQTTINPVRNGGVEQRGLDHTALGVGSVQHRHLAARKTVAYELAHLVDHPLRFCEVAGGLIDPYRLARTLVGTQVFTQTCAVVADQRVGRVQDIAVAAVVLLELDLVAHTKLAHKVRHIADPCAAKGVNALVIVAYRQHRPALPRRPGHATGIDAGKHLHPGVLQLVGVLELVNQDMAKAALVMRADVGMVAQQLVAAQHQLTKIHHAFALALFFVQLVQVDLAPGLGIAQFHVLRAQAVFFATGDEPHEFFGRQLVFIDTHLFAQALDRTQLVLGVQNLEGLRQVGRLVVGAQKTVAQAVEGADPHGAHVDRQHGRQARHHLFGRLVGEGHRQHAAGGDMAVLQQPGDARGQHPGLAGARSGQDQRVFGGEFNSSALLRIQGFDQGGWEQHRGIVGSR